ncbi:MAG: hypothetical protein RSB70_06430 [Clostridium sp.]
MKVYKEKNTKDKLYFTNYNRLDEEEVFNSIMDTLKAVQTVSIGSKKVGPSEDVYECNINGVGFSLVYDIDYGGLIQSDSQEALKLLEEILNR